MDAGNGDNERARQNFENRAHNELYCRRVEGANDWSRKAEADAENNLFTRAFNFLIF